MRNRIHPIVFGLPAVPAVAAATASTPITYIYDEIGRLEAVVDPTVTGNGVAKYAYDDVGNLLSITRQSVTKTRLIDFHGKTGQVGSTVTIYGSSFNTTVAQNQVRFNGSAGTVATVTSANATKLTITVPPGIPAACTIAPGCVLWVKNLGTNQTATSTQTYVVTGSLSPTISGITPGSGAIGASVTITGTNFATTSPASNNVFFNDTRAQVTAVTSTSLTVKVPPFATSGKVSVQTANGETTFTTDFVTAPVAYAVGDVESASRLTLGQSSMLSIATGTKVALGLFDATQDQRIFVDIAGATTASYPRLDFYDPFGRPVHLSGVSPTGAYYDTMLLPFDGTYTVVFDPQGSETGNVTFTIVDAVPVTGSITPGGPAVPVSTTVMGQDVRLTFNGTVGQRVSLKITNSTFVCTSTFTIIEPTGRDLGRGTLCSASGFLDVKTLDWPGIYTVVVSPDVRSSGSATLQLYDVPADPNFPITLGGSAVTATTTVPGQNFTLSFAGTAGQRASIYASNATYPCCPRVTIQNPDGSVLQSGNLYGSAGPSFLGPFNLTQTGTYTVAVDLDSDSIGSQVFQAWDVPADPNYPISIGGGVVTGSNSVPGQNFTLTFSGTSGQNVNLTTSPGTYPCCTVNDFRILRPDGTQLSSGSDVQFGSTTYGPISLDQTGTYTISYDVEDQWTGNRNFQLTLISGLAASRPKPFDRDAGAPASRTRILLKPSSLNGPAPSPDQIASYQAQDIPAWTPQPSSFGGFVTGRAASPFASLPPLEAAPGTTALAGQALELDGTPLDGVTVKVGDSEAATDRTGRFLLRGVDPGKQVLEIDGSTANRGDSTYGFYEAQVDIQPGRTTALGWTIWMTKLDLSNRVAIPAKTTQQVVLRTPAIPGFEVHIPKGSTLKDEDGAPVTELSLTAVPVDRPPFPLPGLEFSMYFTVQPGSTYVSGRGAWVVYPNLAGLAPGVRVPFWHYFPEGKGWQIYGHGRVTPDGRRIVPDDDTRIWSFTGGGVYSTIAGPLLSASCVIPSAGGFADAGQFVGQTDVPDPYATTCDGDPEDLATGLFVHGETDLSLPGPMPIKLTRQYRQDDSNTYSFGLGTGMPYDMYLYSGDQAVSLDLVIPGEKAIHFTKVAGTGQSSYVHEALSTPGPFYRSRLYLTGTGYVIYRRDGLRYLFGASGALQSIVDRFGNSSMTIRPISSIQGLVAYPTGRWISLSTTNGVVTSAVDSLGRTVNYSYENPAGGVWRLKTITDANQVGLPTPKSTVLTWNASTVVNMNPSAQPSPGTYLEKIKDPRGNTIIQNQYDSLGRVDQQTVASGGQYLTDYSGGSECPGMTKLTDPNGNKRCIGVDGAGYATSTLEAVGTPEQRTFAYQLDANTHQIKTVTDSFHGRVTRYTYDAFGNLKTVTRPDGTADAKTTTYDWTPLSQLRSITDPLGNGPTYGYDPANGCLTSVTDALSQQATLTCNKSGQPTTITYPGVGSNRTTTYSYSHGDLVSMTDPLSRPNKRFTDAGGRLLAITDPLGYTNRYTYDALGNTKTVVDARGKITSFSYDENSNFTRITDAKNSQTNFTYFPSNLLQTKTDALNNLESYSYDPKGNLVLRTDRKNQVTEYRYNAYDRPTFIGYKRQGSPGSYTYESTLTLGYDGGWRLTSVADSTTGAGTITRAYDDLDRLTSDQQPQGSVSYTYWNDDRRKTMTAGNQAVTNYSYFANGLLQQISRGSASIAFTYLPNHLPQTKTLPGGQVETYGYDAANELTSIAYSGSGIPASSQITYGYDPVGRRTGVWDAWARIGLPTAMAGPATYNADNQLTSWNGTVNTYDLNGNLTAAGTQTYAWNARDQLTATSGGTASFIYDGLGRRIKKVASGTTKFLYDGLNPVQEQNNGGSVTADLVTGLGLDQTYQRTVSGTSYNFLTDVLGSTVALVAGSTLSPEYTYQPYGASTQTGSIANPYRFTGREWDGTTGLQYNRARYYNPTWGRFVNEDPIGFRGSGANSYVYVGDSPTMFTDPTGLEAEQNVADCAKGGALGGFGLFIKFTLVTFLISAAVGCIGSVFIPPPSDVLVNSGQAFAPIFPGSWPH